MACDPSPEDLLTAQLILNETRGDDPRIPRAGQALIWTGLPGSARLLALAELAGQLDHPIIAVTANSAQAQRWLSALRFYSRGHVPVHLFPDWETLPYDGFSPHQDITSERLATLRALPELTRGILIVPVATLMQRIAPRSYIAGSAFDFQTGGRIDIVARRETLDAAGYQHTDTVTERGQYAIRGSVMDIYPMGSELPVRLDLFDDEIDSLRTFDPDSQRTVEKIERLEVLPAKEFPFDAQAIAGFRDRWHHRFDVDVRRCAVYQDVSSAIVPNGVEYYLPLFFPTLGSLFEHLPNNIIMVRDAGVDAAAKSHWEEVENRFESLRHDVERPILRPDELFLRVDELRQHSNLLARIDLDQKGGKHEHNFGCPTLPEIQTPATSGNLSALIEFRETHPHPTLFVAESAGRREVLDEMLRKHGVHTTVVEDFGEFIQLRGDAITIADLDQGLALADLSIVTENDLFGTRQQDHRRETGQPVIDPDQIVRNLTELSIGAPVVHIEHGVGRYQGLQTLTIDDERHEFLMLTYADEDKLYVPVTALHLISRYAGADEEHAPLHRLGSDQWEKAKRRAAEKVVDVAAELLDIYARRALRTSHEFTLRADEYEQFCQEFPFEVTTDQQTAITDTLADMTTSKAMDRLICGDVGFGKTEVAMRAAFVAAQEGKQVAVLVPTTLLAQQHFDTFRDRFAHWPVQIEVISRLRTPADLTRIGEETAAGKVDILIGTHKLLSDNFRFKNLGLIIIDEEHRFGVRQKEQLKKLRAEVDVLILTATPIPRTLNMSLSGIRDLSIIATPPAKRLAINTFVQEQRNHIIKEAISRELLRGGQVFYLHNEVKTIQQCADAVAEMVPEARIGVGHGQMPKHDLETVMGDFYHRQLNVLVCTTIIETGIDIPNANTIIIERADRFGLAQLHQLRGRVGRSHRQAYAYLLTPHPKAMTGDAQKRLDAIEAAGDLGVGFTLATHDMEIRGAGELLGDDQSGQIEAIGFSMYMDMLNRAVKALQSGQVPDVERPLEPVSQDVNLHAPTLIPEDYLPDVHTRLIQYKRIASAANGEELQNLQVEMIDRFGLLPDAVRRLFAVTALKLHSEALGITKVDIGPERGKLEFSNQTRVDPIKIVNLVQQYPGTYRLEGASILRVSKSLETFAARETFVLELLGQLAPEQSAAA
ncbi:MAG: transcription-repair coupling factor [Pseudomonadota bacterium]